MSTKKMNYFVLWYLTKEGYRKSAKIFEKSIQSEKNLSKEKIEKFEKVIKQVKNVSKERFYLLYSYQKFNGLFLV